MRPDILQLANFYDSPLGLLVRQLLRAKIDSFWPDLTKARVMGFGYATPLMEGLDAEAERVVALMPASMGVMHWPGGGSSRAALVEEVDLPIADSVFDYVLVLHGLETAPAPSTLLRELWRVLAPEGRMIMICPGRRGVWARKDSTPFGHGQPWSAAQLTDLLRDCMFQPLRWERGLYVPPSQNSNMLAMSGFYEWAGPRFWSRFGGVHIVEAKKQVFAKPHKLRVRERNRVLAGRPVAVPTARKAT